MEELDLATNIQTLLIAPAQEPRAAVPSNPINEVISLTKAASVPHATVINKGKETYLYPPKKMPQTKRKEALLGLPLLLWFRLRTKKMSPFWGV